MQEIVHFNAKFKVIVLRILPLCVTVRKNHVISYAEIIVFFKKHNKRNI